MIISFWITQVVHFDNLISLLQTEVWRKEPRYPAIKFVPTIRTTISCRLLKRTHWFVRRKNTERYNKVQKRPCPPFLKTGSSFHHPTELSTFDLEAVALNLKQELSPRCGMVQALERKRAENLHKFKASKGYTVRLHF